MRLIACLAVCAVVATLAVGQASASPLLAVNFSSTNNDLQAGFNLQKTPTATFSGHDVTVSGANFFSSGEFTNSGELTYAALYRGEVFSNQDNAVGSFVISGFTPLTQYKLTFFSYDNGHTVTTFFKETGNAAVLGSVSYVAGAVPTTNYQYSTTFTLTSDAAGSLNVSANASPSYRLRVNGFEVNAVPEPATMVLLSIGGLSLIRRRK